MSTFQPTVSWHLQRGVEFDYEHYNRDHEWTFPGGEVVPASASTMYGGTAQRVNPDEAVVAATASCHMLTFLAIAAKAKKKVISYIDRPEGTVDKNADGYMAITKIVLHPKVVFDEEVDEATLKRFHDSAHRHCFVSNSPEDASDDRACIRFDWRVFTLETCMHQPHLTPELSLLEDQLRRFLVRDIASHYDQ